MTSVNVTPIQLYDNKNDGTIKSHNLDIRVAVLSFMSMADYFFKIN